MNDWQMSPPKPSAGSATWSSKTFVEYALSSNLSEEETYTIEMLIKGVQFSFDDTYFDHWHERDEARQRPDYRPHFAREHVQPAARELEKKTWLSLQPAPHEKRPIRDVTPLRYFPSLKMLFLGSNEVADVSPIIHCVALTELDLHKNSVRDLSPLVSCKNLVELNIRDNPIEDLSVLEVLPHLRKLHLSTNQLPLFKKLRCLPSLRELLLDSEPFDSFVGFPEMPELRELVGASVNTPLGIEKFFSLLNLTNFGGEMTSLSPIQGLRKLTHINILGSNISSLEPISQLVALRDVCVYTTARKLDLTPLEKLPALHEVAIKCDDSVPRALKKLRSTLTPWDVEFSADKPRHTPSLTLEVVDEETFDLYNQHKPYGVTEADDNVSLLASERDWVATKIEEAFSADFDEGEDYSLPYRVRHARSMTVVLLSERAIEAFRKLALLIQDVLSRCRNDWIIYFQSDHYESKDEFVVWVYPYKIMVTNKYHEAVTRLVDRI